MCISDNFPGNVSAAGPGTIHGTIYAMHSWRSFCIKNIWFSKSLCRVSLIYPFMMAKGKPGVIVDRVFRVSQEQTWLWTLAYRELTMVCTMHSNLKFSDKSRPGLGPSEIPTGSCYLFEFASHKETETRGLSIMIRCAV